MRLHFVDPFTHRWTCGLLPLFAYCRQCCCGHGCTSISWCPCFQLFGYITRCGIAGLYFEFPAWQVNILWKAIGKKISMLKKEINCSYISEVWVHQFPGPQSNLRFFFSIKHICEWYIIAMVPCSKNSFICLLLCLLIKSFVYKIPVFWSSWKTSSELFS